MSLTESSPFDIAKAASEASRELATIPIEARNAALTAIHGLLKQKKDIILAANAKDVESATTAVEKGDLSESILKRLDLKRPGKYDDMLQGILDVRELDDPGTENDTSLSVLVGVCANYCDSKQNIFADFDGR